MSDLTTLEKRKLENFLGMRTGCVLDFSNRSFAKLVRDSTGLDIYDQAYHYVSGSKANRLRAFWHRESNPVVGRLLKNILEYSEDASAQAEACRLIVGRLLRESQAAQANTCAEAGGRGTENNSDQRNFVI